jgi:low affinity Fe/Cu permease
MSRDSGQAQLSRFLRTIDALSSRAGTATAIAAVVGAAVVAVIAAGFPSHWTSVFSLCTAAITLVMVFVIQHTQSREQTATQLKLDEIIRALPQADDHLVHVEAAQDEELEDLQRRQTAHHESLRSGPGS